MSDLALSAAALPLHRRGGTPPHPVELDDEAEQRSFTVDAGAGAAVSYFRVAGVHCAACAPRLEAALAVEPGVLAVAVGAGGRRVAVTWSREATRPSRLAACIGRAGFEATPDVAEPARALRQRERRRGVWQLFVAAFCAMQVMMYATPFYVAADGLEPDLRRLLLWASWLLSVPVLVFAAGPLLRGAWAGLRRRQVRMELPASIGIVVAFAASSWTTLAGREGDVWFDSLTMFVALLLAARWLALAAEDRVAAALEEAIERVPRSARRVDAPGHESVVALSALRRGDQVRVAAGEAFPADGPLVSGSTEVDESLLTGESRGVVRGVGDRALAGSLNLGGAVVQRVVELGAGTRHEQIVALLRSAAFSRPRLLRVADRVAGPFLVAVLLLAAIAGAAWGWIDPSRALEVAVAVLVVTCPCALALAAPATLLAAAGALARRGVLVSHLDAIEAAARFDRIAFDKTGTLTGDRLRLVATDVEAAAALRHGGAERVVAIARSLAASSNHPRARALAEGAPSAAGLDWLQLREEAGAGVEGSLEIGGEARRFRLGARRWVAPLGGDPAHPARDAGGRLWLGDEAGLLASFALDESLRDDAASTVAALRGQGIAVALLSGDDRERVRGVAARLGIDDARGGLDPDAKLAALAQWQEVGERVAMVGDGINDAPVMARADLSLAMAGGSALTRARADIVLASGRLADVVVVRSAARRAMRIVRQNLGWALAYNAVGVPLAAIGAFPPWAAGIGMAVSSLLVVGNGLRAGHRLQDRA